MSETVVRYGSLYRPNEVVRTDHGEQVFAAQRHVGEADDWGSLRD